MLRMVAVAVFSDLCSATAVLLQVACLNMSMRTIIAALPNNSDCCCCCCCCCCCADKQLADLGKLANVLREYCISHDAPAQAAARFGSAHTHRSAAAALVQQQQQQRQRQNTLSRKQQPLSVAVAAHYVGVYTSATRGRYAAKACVHKPGELLPQHAAAVCCFWFSQLE
jgi:hypothetical protein